MSLRTNRHLSMIRSCCSPEDLTPARYRWYSASSLSSSPELFLIKSLRLGSAAEGKNIIQKPNGATNTAARLWLLMNNPCSEIGLACGSPSQKAFHLSAFTTWSLTSGSRHWPNTEIKLTTPTATTRIHAVKVSSSGVVSASSPIPHLPSRRALHRRYWLSRNGSLVFRSPTMWTYRRTN